MASKFTKIDNYFLDKIMPLVSCAEWKIICAVLRLTVGEFCDEATIPVERFEALTGFASQAVNGALKKVIKRGVVRRRLYQVKRQRSFRYHTVAHGNLKAIGKQDPRRHQDALPFDPETASQPDAWDSENHNPKPVEKPGSGPEISPVGIVKITIPNPRWDGENHNPNAESYLLIKRSRSKNTHTDELTDSENHNPKPVEKPAASPRVCGSRFSKLQIRKYAYASYHFDATLRSQRKNTDGIRNPEGWATIAHRTGEYDDLIQEWIEDPNIFRVEQVG